MSFRDNMSKKLKTPKQIISHMWWLISNYVNKFDVKILMPFVEMKNEILKTNPCSF